MEFYPPLIKLYDAFNMYVLPAETPPAASMPVDLMAPSLTEMLRAQSSC